MFQMSRPVAVRAFVLMMTVGAASASASPIGLDFHVTLAAAEYFRDPAGENNSIQYFSDTTAPFVVVEGDTVTATFWFDQVLRVLYDPLSPSVAVQARLLVANLSLPPFSISFIPSFSFLDSAGTPILSVAEARQIHTGGDVGAGGGTMTQLTDIDVSGVRFQMTDILNAGGGGLPVTFRGAGVLVYNAQFGEPFNSNAAPVPKNAAPLPEPTSLLLLGTGLAGVAARRWRQRAGL